MPAPGEHKTAQARLPSYAQEVGWRVFLSLLVLFFFGGAGYAAEINKLNLVGCLAQLLA
jgi:hypothetical protein